MCGHSFKTFGVFKDTYFNSGPGETPVVELFLEEQALIWIIGEGKCVDHR